MGVGGKGAEHHIARFERILQASASGGEYGQGVMPEGGEVRGSDVMGGDGTNFDLAEFGKLDADLEFAVIWSNAKLAGVDGVRWIGKRV